MPTTKRLVLDINTSEIEAQLTEVRQLLNLKAHTRESIDQFIAALCNHITIGDGVSTADASGVCTFSCNAKFAISFDDLTAALRADDVDMHNVSLLVV